MLMTPTPSISDSAASPPIPPARTTAFHRSFTSISAWLYATLISITLRFSSPFSRSSCSIRARSWRVASPLKSAGSEEAVGGGMGDSEGPNEDDADEDEDEEEDG